MDLLNKYIKRDAIYIWQSRLIMQQHKSSMSEIPPIPVKNISSEEIVHQIIDFTPSTKENTFEVDGTCIEYTLQGSKQVESIQNLPQPVLNQVRIVTGNSYLTFFPRREGNESYLKYGRQVDGNVFIEFYVDINSYTTRNQEVIRQNAIQAMQTRNALNDIGVESSDDGLRLTLYSNDDSALRVFTNYLTSQAPSEFLREVALAIKQDNYNILENIPSSTTE